MFLELDITGYQGHPTIMLVILRVPINGIVRNPLRFYSAWRRFPTKTYIDHPPKKQIGKRIKHAAGKRRQSYDPSNSNHISYIILTTIRWFIEPISLTMYTCVYILYDMYNNLPH